MVKTFVLAGTSLSFIGNDGFAVTEQNTGQVFVGDTSHTLSGWMVSAAFTPLGRSPACVALSIFDRCPAI